MKKTEKDNALQLRRSGLSIKEIASQIGVAKSSVSVWVRNIELTDSQLLQLKKNPHRRTAIEKRRITRLKNEEIKRQKNNFRRTKFSRKN